MRRYVQCTYCKQFKYKIRSGKKNGSSYIYTDENGASWRSGKCPACRRTVDTLYARRKGHQHIDNVENCAMAIGRNAERSAAQWLIACGFNNVKLNNGKGPDITATRGNKTFTFEVKRVVRQQTRRSLFVCKVAPTRINDDYIIYVYKNKHIMFPMREHLKRCWTNGARRVTEFFNEIKRA